MTQTLQDISNIQIFLDDVIIVGSMRVEHLRALTAVLQLLSDNGLKLKQSKCIFLVDEVTYLGYMVSEEGIRANKTQIQPILYWYSVIEGKCLLYNAFKRAFLVNISESR